MFTAAIIEDEETNILLIKTLIERNNLPVRIVGEARSVDNAVNLLLRLKPEVVFMDVKIIGGNAFDVLQRTPEIQPELIFLTAYDQYAIPAIKNNAADYLLKPFDTSDFIAAVLKVADRIRNKQLAGERRLARSMAVTTGNTTELIPFDDIYYLEADGSYTHIYTAKGKFTTSHNIGEYEEEVPADSFFRTHHSYIVNLCHITSVEMARSGKVQLQNGESVPVSQRRLTEFKKRLAEQKLIMKS